MKPKFSKELLFLIANIFDAASGALLIKAGFGNSPMGAFPLVLNEIFPSLSIGTMNFIVQIFVLILLICLIKKFSVYYMMSFLAAAIYDAFLDIFMSLFSNFPLTDNYRILYLVMGLVLLGLGCGAYLYTSLPLMPFDICVHDISEKFKKDHGNVKLTIDCIFLIATIISSVIFFKRVDFIGIATIIVAFTNGTLITIYDNILFNRFEFTMSTKIGKYLETLKPI